MKPDAKTPTQTLMDERIRLVTEMEALQNKIRGLDLAIELISAGVAGAVESQTRGRGISDTIRHLLKAAGPEGLTVSKTVDLAAERGLKINKTSVSSLLSRMKRDGEVVYRAKKYVMK